MLFSNENNLPLTSDERESLQTDWTSANVTSLGYTMDQNCVFQLYNWIRDKSEDFVPVKTPEEQYNKVLKGCPEALFNEIVAEQKLMDRAPIAPSFVFPAVYPANHPQAGAVHPFAGQPDPLALVKYLSAHLRKMIDQGMVRVKSSKVNVIEDEDDDVMAIRNARNDKRGFKGGKDRNGKSVELTEQSRCYRCGGLGHFAVTNGQKCLTSIKISREILDAIKYPHIKNERPVPKDLTVNEVSDSDESGDDENADVGMIEEDPPSLVACTTEEIHQVEDDLVDEDNFMQDFS